MASPVSCRNLKRLCLNSQIVRMVRVRSMMKMSRSAVSCLWLSSALFSVTMFSMALSSSREDAARQTQMLTDTLTSMSSHSVLVALQALLTVNLDTMTAFFAVKCCSVVVDKSKLCPNVLHELGEKRAERRQQQSSRFRPGTDLRPFTVQITETKMTSKEYASTVRRIAQSSSQNIKDRLTIELHPDGRHGIVRVDRVPLACKLVDLPCMIESLKTVDKKTFYKTADVCQMLVCTLDGDLYPPLEEPTGTDPKSKKKDKDKDKKFVWNHGRWEIIAEDESKEGDQHGSLANLDSSPGTSGHKMGHGSSAQRDELREIFNDISSSSEDEEDEGDRHEDEDLNIMDTEDDLVRQLQEKLNEADSAQHESDRNNQIVMEYQVQINSVKGKLQDTRARKKQQEELIMKVENQALKNRFQALLDEIILQEEREMEQLASLQEQLDSLIEK
ncbi:hypothetical protein F7725_010376 [Dissostichus mawsoni]|uniref:TAFII55 protein conserved region domain-containing protein n=1 Tax=Dissostichus mawsoni TaxID=36200 RepID=A0A7J5XRB6_DISMA|nr:hypothetical protein F7725_010376 [Dissostichus mawsoni]